jgi:lipopolysaccharide/colanic/teichoic acid biosynthesis glycosyltransferase
MMTTNDIDDYDQMILQNDIKTESQYDWFAVLIYGAKPSYYTNYAIIKRVFDITLIVVAIPLWLPVMCACSILIKLEDPGAPVIFRQERTGMLGRRFTFYKFRTMIRSAEQLKASLVCHSELSWPDFKIKDDPRVTPLGRFLRKYSLDELPQLFNVIIGDMSLVGPRPTSFTSDTYQPWQRERLIVRPGITGLSQVIDRDSMEFEDRVRFDLAYVHNRCLVLDILESDSESD